MWVDKDLNELMEKLEDANKKLKNDNSRLQSRVDSAHDKIKFLEGLWDTAAATLQSQWTKIEALEKESLKLLCKISTLQGNMDGIMLILKDLIKKDWEK